VLEIGTGSGYQAAVLSQVVSKVFTVERVPELAAQARNLLEKLGYKNVIVTVGDGTLGWSKYAPFDRIIITAAAPKIPLNLLPQLTEAGILVTPVGDLVHQTLKIVKKTGDEHKIINSIDCIFVPLIGLYGWEKGKGN
jgi:protein-L-isoaspartate(D-aspartate) O-methyltransferase